MFTIDPPLLAIPYPPVGQLKLFVCLYAAAVLEKEGEGELWQVEDSTGLPRVKQVDQVESKVPLKP